MLATLQRSPYIVDMSNDVLMTTTEVARELGISVTRVNFLARAGRIPTAHKGAGRTSARMFHQADIEQLKRARETAA